jgi:putative endonuclease
MMRSVSTRALGYAGEQLAEQYLTERGYRILERNYTVKHGEIDLIAQEGETLVFIEVKSHSREDYGTMLSRVNRSKQKKIIFAARCFLVRYGNREIPCRFDVLAILNQPGGTKRIELIKDAFRWEASP